MAMGVSEIRRIRLLGPSYAKGNGKGYLWNAELSLDINHNLDDASGIVRNASIRTLSETAESKDYTLLHPAKLDTKLYDPKVLRAAVRPHIGYGSGLAIGTNDDGDAPVARSFSLAAPARSGTKEPLFSLITAVPALVPKDDTKAVWPSKKGPQIELPPLALASGAIAVIIPKEGKIKPRSVWDWLSARPGPNDGELKGFASLFSPSGPAAFYASSFIQKMDIVTVSVSGEPVEKPADGKEGSEPTISHSLKAEIPCVLARLTRDGIEFDGKMCNPFDRDNETPIPARVRLEVDQPTGAFQLRLLSTNPPDAWRGRVEGILAALRASHAPVVASLQPAPLQLVWDLKSVGALEFEDFYSPRLAQGAISASLVTNRLPGSTIAPVAQLVEPQARITTRADGTRALCLDAGQPSKGGAIKVALRAKAVKGSFDEYFGITFEKAPPASAADPKPLPAPVSIDGKKLKQDLIDRYVARGLRKSDSIETVDAFLALERGVLQIPVDVPFVKPSEAAVVRKSFIGSVYAVSASRNMTLLVEDAGFVTITATLPKGEDPTLLAEFRDAAGTVDGILWTAERTPTAEEVVPTLASGPISLSSLRMSFGDPAALVNASWTATVRIENDVVLGGVKLSVPTTEARTVIAWTPANHKGMALAAAVNMTRTARNATTPSLTRDLIPTFHEVGKDKTLAIALAFSPSSPLPTLGDIAGAETPRREWWGLGPRDVPMVAITLPGVEFSTASSDLAAPWQSSLRFDLPLLDEFHASQAPSREPASKSDDEQPTVVTALEIGAMRTAWQDARRRLKLARTQAGYATAWGSSDVTGLIEPFTWAAKFATSVDAKLPFGRYTLGDTEFAGEAALADKIRKFKRNDKDATIVEAPGDEKAIEVVGFAVKPYAQEVGKLNFLTDTRGIGLAPAVTVMGNLTTRAVVTTDAKGKLSPVEFLLTTTKPYPLNVPEKKPDDTGKPEDPETPEELKPRQAFLELRDLPVTVGPLSDKDTRAVYIFNRKSTPEGMSAVDLQVFSREKLPKSIYEWRLFEKPDDGARPAFALSLGPLSLRPLRLMTLVIDKESGEALSAVVVYSVHLATPEVATPEESGPFAEDFNYKTGNSIAVAYSSIDACLKPTAVVNISKADIENEKWAFPEKPDASRIELQVEAEQTKGQASGLLGMESASFRVGIELPLVAQGGKLQPGFEKGALTIRLLGTDVHADLKSVQATDTVWTFEASVDAGKVTAARLAISSIQFGLSPKPTIAIAGKIGLGTPHGKGNAITDFPVLLDLNGEVSIFGWKGEVSWETDSVEHGAGVLTSVICGIKEADGGPRLLRGLRMPISEAFGVVALAFSASPTNTIPLISAAYFEFEGLGPAKDGGFNYRVRQYQRKDVETVVEERLVISLPEESRQSMIKWPRVDRSSINDYPEDAYREQPDKVARPVLKLSSYEHVVTAKVIDLEVPIDAIGRQGPEWLLDKPLRAKIFCTHALKEKTKAALLEWTSIDDISILDIRVLQDGLSKTTAYAFSAAYKREDPRFRSAGVTLSGELDYVLTQVLKNAVLAAEEPLAIFGSATIEATMSQSRAARTGLVFSLPWLMAAGDGVVSPFGNFTQLPAGGTFALASFDIAGGARGELPADAPMALSFGRGGIEEVKRALANTFGRRALEPARAVDRAFGENLVGAIKVKTILQTPVFWQAIMALSTLSHSAENAAAGISVATLLSTGSSVHQIRLAARLSGKDDAGGTDDNRAHDLWVVGRKQVGVTDVWLAGIDENDAEAVRPLGVLAAEKVAEPLSVVLAHVRPGDLTLRRHDKFSLIIAAPKTLSHPQVKPLRKAADTIFASPALGWPRASTALSGNALEVGEQQPLQDPSVAWAGRARSFGGQMRALTDEKQTRSFLAIGQHVLFDRTSALDAAAPPDRALIPVPARARLPATKDGGEAGVVGAGMLPGQYEVISTGVRPGVLVVEHAGIVAGKHDESFDGQHERFGAPADRAPVSWSQGRAPRSTALPRTDDLAKRRRTFLGENLRSGAGTNEPLLPFVLTKGPGTSLHYTSGDGKVTAVCVTVIHPPLGRLGPNFDGMIVLSLDGRWQFAGKPDEEVEKEIDAIRQDMGLTGRLYCELVVGGAKATFGCQVFTKRDDNSIRLELSEPAEDASGQLAAALAGADADTEARLVIRQVPLFDDKPKGSAAALSSAVAEGEPPRPKGPPRILSLALPLVPHARPWLPIETATVMFGDPAYDRELAGPALSAERIDGDTRTCLVVDRFAYDPGETIYFLFGKRNPDFDMPPPMGKAEPPPFLVTESRSLDIKLLREVPGEAAPREIPLVAKDLPSDKNLLGGVAYALPIASLMRRDSTEPLAIKANDRIVLKLDQGTASEPLSLSVTIVPEPVVAPPSSVFAVVTFDEVAKPRNEEKEQKLPWLTPVLVASAPLPQRIEFTDLVMDLARGHVRRRAVFEWAFAARTALSNGGYAGLVKIDRTGGGQICEKLEDLMAPINL